VLATATRPGRCGQPGAGPAGQLVMFVGVRWVGCGSRGAHQRVSFGSTHVSKKLTLGIDPYVPSYI